MTKARIALAQKIMDHAERHYNESGWDFIVECYTVDELAEWSKELAANTLDQFIKKAMPILDTFDDRRQDALNSAF